MRWLWVCLLVTSLAGCADEPAAEPPAPASYFDSGDMASGAAFTFTFPEPLPEGYSYHCHPHPWMTGMVHVQPDTDGETNVHQVLIVEGETAEEWGYEPQHLMIEVGDTVVWTNSGSVIHTVTEAPAGEHDHGSHAH